MDILLCMMEKTGFQILYKEICLAEVHIGMTPTIQYGGDNFNMIIKNDKEIFIYIYSYAML